MGWGTGHFFERTSSVESAVLLDWGTTNGAVWDLIGLVGNWRDGDGRLIVVWWWDLA
jgi:hypothetical protein